MQWTASVPADTTLQRLSLAPGKPRVFPNRMRRGLPLNGATDSAAMVERMLCAADLDAAMRTQLTRVLLITVRDWSRSQSLSDQEKNE